VYEQSDRMCMVKSIYNNTPASGQVILYIDFCRIWELNRSVDSSKDTNGKSLCGF